MSKKYLFIILHNIKLKTMILEFDFPPNIESTIEDVGYNCECCGRFIKRYRRKLNSNMALTLVHLYRADVKDYIHVENFLINLGFQRSGDFHKLVLWGLLDKKKGSRDDGSSRNGYYKLNEKSIDFVLGKSKMQEVADIFNGNFEKFEGKEITIKDALGSKFNYNELING